MKRKLHRPVVKSQRWKVNNARPAGINKLFVAGVWTLLHKVNKKEKGKSWMVNGKTTVWSKTVTCRDHQGCSQVMLHCWFTSRKKSKCVECWVYTPRPGSFKGEKGSITSANSSTSDMGRHWVKSWFEEQTDAHGMKVDFRNASVSAHISDLHSDLRLESRLVSLTLFHLVKGKAT